MKHCGLDLNKMVKEFNDNLTNSILLQKSIPDFLEKVAFNIKFIIDKSEKGLLRLRMEPEIIASQSDPEAKNRIQDYQVAAEKLEGQSVVLYLEQVSKSNLSTRSELKIGLSIVSIQWAH